MSDRLLTDPSPPTFTPTDSAFKDLARRKPSKPESSGPYQQIVGSLLWAAQCNRPDISFAVNRLSQFLKDPSKAHWQAACRVLWYLVTTKHLWLRLGGSLKMCGFSDSDWAEDRQDRRPTSGYKYHLGSGSISWKSSKQATVSLSSTEAEYKAMSYSCKEGLWLRNLLRELKLIPSTSIPLHVNNAGAKALSKNPEHHTRTKHIDARFHFIWECVKKDKLAFLHVSTKDMLADMLTKPLRRVPLESHCQAIGVV
jgi:hypothetical protein